MISLNRKSTHTNRTNKILLIAVLVSYVFIVLPLEKWNIFLGIVILLSPLGLPNFPDIIYFPFGYLSIILTVWKLFSKTPRTGNDSSFIRLLLLCYYIPLISYHCIEPFSIGRYDFLISIMPEIMFIIVSILLFMKTCVRI